MRRHQSARAGTIHRMKKILILAVLVTLGVVAAKRLRSA